MRGNTLFLLPVCSLKRYTLVLGRGASEKPLSWKIFASLRRVSVVPLGCRTSLRESLLWSKDQPLLTGTIFCILVLDSPPSCTLSAWSHVEVVHFHEVLSQSSPNNVALGNLNSPSWQLSPLTSWELLWVATCPSGMVSLKRSLHLPHHLSIE